MKELELYSEFVSIGSYLIVEDTNIYSRPVVGQFEEGPFEAVQEFLKNRDDFITNRDCEKNFFTFNPSGFLLKVR